MVHVPSVLGWPSALLGQRKVSATDWSAEELSPRSYNRSLGFLGKEDLGSAYAFF